METSIKQMMETFRAYRATIAEKKESLPERPPPPVFSAPTGSSPDQNLRHLQTEQRSSADLQLTTQKVRIQGAVKHLVGEITVSNWEIADDDEVKKAMKKVAGWETRQEAWIIRLWCKHGALINKLILVLNSRNWTGEGS